MADVCEHDPLDIVWSVVDGETFLLDTASGHYFSLNPLGTEIWEYLQRGESTPDIARIIAEKYRIAEAMASADVTALLDELRASRLWNGRAVERVSDET